MRGSPPHAWGHTSADDATGCAASGSPPHAWGHTSSGAPPVARHGSPPHAWGHTARCISCARQRFTPTRVGTHASEHGHDASRRFTPTRVGTHGIESPHGGCVRGSPPHAWGHTIPARRLVRGIAGSPPHAWGTPCQPLCMLMLPVHPHTRGEHVSRLPRGVEPSRFTPTRVGTHVDEYQPASARRFTPTRVGNTQAAVNRCARLGSPPHAWGTPGAVTGYDGARRFTPDARGGPPDGINVYPANRFPPRAWGTTVQHQRRLQFPSVHPHARGDHSIGEFLTHTRLGSPPHTRGDHGPDGQVYWLVDGSTPTRGDHTNETPMERAVVLESCYLVSSRGCLF